MTPNTETIVRLATLLGAYLLGGCAPGYWLVRWRTGRDVRAQGSGTTGATNAGRVLGTAGFVAVLLADAAKGALSIAVCRWLGGSEVWAFATAGAVIAGHIWPVQLGFRGGKGVAPLLGAWLLLAPVALLPCAGAGLLVFAKLRRFTVSALGGLLLLPATTWWWTNDEKAALVTFACMVMVGFAHRAHLRDTFRRGSKPARS